MAAGDVRDRLALEATPGEHDAIRELWKRHSIAEDERDLPGLLATLTDDCVYELPQTGHVWRGHDGAAQFYSGLLAAFPDVRFALSDIVIGPQGVCEEARVTATHRGPWLGMASASSSPSSSSSPGIASGAASAANASMSGASSCRRRSGKESAARRRPRAEGAPVARSGSSPRHRRPAGARASVARGVTLRTADLSRPRCGPPAATGR